MTTPHLSVIVCVTADTDEYELQRAIRRTARQDYPALSVVVVADAAPDRAALARDALVGTDRDGQVVEADHRRGLAAARNAGTGVADGDAYAFLDADAAPRPGWAAAIGDLLASTTRPAVGGPAYPIWPAGRPLWLAPQWDWAVGCGPYYNSRRAIRNTYGCNWIVRASAFDAADGFGTQYGHGGGLNVHGEETDLAQRLGRRHGGLATVYDPDIAVDHQVSRDQIGFVRALRRARRQGATKAHLGIDGRERKFLRDALDTRSVGRLTGSLALLGATALGYGAERLMQPRGSDDPPARENTHTQEIHE